ncbi:MAG: hypothetical protein A3J62_01920 [Candidatus Buchananbacteria bacterium RIFCSPHIGHO2_02_FULL_38_8]|uniref:Uncharacterized protein n=1 Tax=Candidatus Buchananbacteria bacterium RIFCSPHIGHO2_02_FULL_38_8 TaxID=1797538 RepID=A0A1G1Y4I7_9BACT|nr:hypothetical protein [uncultured bacterium]OGY47161.1 MAG: hypothetical protein A3J62_01920 [Candidatus Buchananbacteria bacterium RIFCSPHIGHO2_02_FULL_38_8]
MSKGNFLSKAEGKAAEGEYVESLVGERNENIELVLDFPQDPDGMSRQKVRIKEQKEELTKAAEFVLDGLREEEYENLGFVESYENLRKRAEWILRVIETF